MSKASVTKDQHGGSEILASVHRLAADFHDAGIVDKQTMRKFDALCLTTVKPMAPEDIRALREAEGLSQAVLARVLNVTTNAVSQWERGEKRPTGSALKLLALARSKGIATIM